MSSISPSCTKPRFRASPEWVAQATIKKADYEAMCAAAGRDFEGFWADSRRRSRGTGHSESARRKQRAVLHVVRGWRDERPYNCLDRNLEKGNPRVAIIFEADDGKSMRHVSRPYHRVPSRQWAQVARREEGRSRRHLYADVDRRHRGDAGVRADRRDASWYSAASPPSRCGTNVDAGRSSSRPTSRYGRQAATAEGDRRRRARHGRLRCRTQCRRLYAQAATSGSRTGRDVWMHELTKAQAETAIRVGRCEHPFTSTRRDRRQPKGVQQAPVAARCGRR